VTKELRPMGGGRAGENEPPHNLRRKEVRTMKYWSIVILEEGCRCSNCGSSISKGDPAFILVDTGKVAGSVVGVNCLDCMKAKFPDAVEGL